MKKTAFIAIATLSILTACGGGDRHGAITPPGEGQDNTTIVDVVSEQVSDSLQTQEFVPVDTVAGANKGLTSQTTDTLNNPTPLLPPTPEKPKGFGFLALVIAFVLGAAAAFVFCMKKSRDTIDKVYEENKRKEIHLEVTHENKLRTIEERLNNQINDLQDKIANLKAQLREANDKAKAFSNQGYGPGYQGFGTTTPPQTTTKPVQQQLPQVTKYGKISIGGDSLVIEDVFLSESPDGMPFRFDFAPDMSMGTFTFTESGRQQFSTDLDFARPYVNAFDKSSGQISVVSPGRFVKSDWAWVVTEKITINVN